MFRLFIFSSFFLLTVIFVDAQVSSLEIDVVNQNQQPVSNFTLKVRKNSDVILTKINHTGEASISNIEIGIYSVEIIADGFETLREEIELKPGNNRKVFQLRVQGIVAEVDVLSSESQKRFEEETSRSFSTEEIQALPDNPQDIEKELKQRFGDNVLIRINGLENAPIPPKDQISSIRISLSSFDAEFHQVGDSVIDITTKLNIKRFTGFVELSGSNYLLNARNPLSEKRIPAGDYRIFSSLVFPTFKKISLFAGFSKNSTQQSIAFSVKDVLHDESISDSKLQTDRISPFVFASYSFGKAGTVNLLGAVSRETKKGLGIGGLNLPERAFNQTSSGAGTEIVVNNILKGKYINSFRSAISLENDLISPISDSPAVKVLGEFSKGGADVSRSRKKLTLENADNLSFDFRNHFVKIGFATEFAKINYEDASNLNGTFIFLNRRSFFENRPFVFTQRTSAALVNTSQFQSSFYFQDDIRLQKKLQIGVGLRYEKQNDLTDNNNLSPRISIVWATDKDAKLIFRAGAGIFYRWLDLETKSRTLAGTGTNGSEVAVYSPDFPNPFSGGILPASSHPNIYVLDSNLRNPQTYVVKGAANFRVTKQFNLRGTYTFKKATHQFRTRDLNVPVDSIRPNSLFGRISNFESSGDSIENSLELNFTGKLISGINFDSKYTIGTIQSDYEDIFDLPTDSNNLHNDFGYSDLDQRHKFRTNIYFPAWHSVIASAIVRFESARPYTLQTGNDDNGDLVLNDRPLGQERNSERGEMFKQFDVRLKWTRPFGRKESSGNTTIGKRFSFQLDVQNLFNSANTKTYIGVITSPLFRQPTLADQPRRIQFGVNFSF